jgi:ParB family transcriptional regulator, chromosome partitioning protein
MVKPALGRGLGALLGSAPALPKPGPPPGPALGAAAPPSAATAEGIRHIPLRQIRPCPFQPRKDFSEESLRELADSIKEQGVVQPLIVRAVGTEFELIAGERRWRAAQIVGLADIPVVVRQADDRTALELALIENLQRENLNPLEEALGFEQLIGQFQLTQEEAAVRVGKSRAAVANALRLLRLPPEVQELLRTGRLSVGHAKVILALASQSDQKAAADRVLSDNLNVRQTEQLIGRWAQAVTPNRSKPAAVTPVAPHLVDLQERMQQRLGTKTTLRYREGKGAIEIRFTSDADLERLLELIGIELD